MCVCALVQCLLLVPHEVHANLMMAFTTAGCCLS